jgi:hypothetical protein
MPGGLHDLVDFYHFCNQGLAITKMFDGRVRGYGNRPAFLNSATAKLRSSRSVSLCAAVNRGSRLSKLSLSTIHHCIYSAVTSNHHHDKSEDGLSVTSFMIFDVDTD